jgi:hypothetical protein
LTSLIADPTSLAPAVATIHVLRHKALGQARRVG